MTLLRGFTGWLTLLVLLGLTPACTTRPKIDWAGRVGTYTYDQAVVDYGPPDKVAQLSEKSTVAEWLTRKGDYRVDTFGYGYYGRPYRPYYYHPGYMVGSQDLTRLPDRYLRLIFDAGGVLTGHHEFSK